MIDPSHSLRKQGCKFCGYEITSEKRTKPLDVFLQQLKEKLPKHFEELRKQKKEEKAKEEEAKGKKGKK